MEYPEVSTAYEKVELIGETHMSKVYTVRYRDEILVLKEIDCSDQRDVIGFFKEVKVMAGIDHPNIMPLRTAFLEDETIFLLMPKMASDLRSRIGKIGLDEQSILIVVKQVATGLKYLHDHGVTHRDLKGSNILIGDDGQIALGDLGSNNASTKCRTFCGTVCWMAPEVLAADDSGYDQRVDLWSLGITMIELAYTQPPYYSMTPLQAMIRLLKDAPPRFDDMPTIGLIESREYSRDFKRLVASLLEKDPEHRITIDQLLAHPLVAKVKRDRL